MPRLRLDDREIRGTIAHFIDEARRSARTRRDDGVLGLAAMSTIMACVCAVGEALIGRRGTTRGIKKFFDKMIDSTSWFLPPEGTAYSDSMAKEQLVAVRHSLTHALCMPLEVTLLPNIEADELHARSLGQAHLRRWRLIVPGFIHAVEETISRLCGEHPELEWDPGGSTERAPVDVYSPATSRDEIVNMVLGTYRSSSAGSAATGTGAYPDRSDDEDEDQGTSLSYSINSTS
jgi:hypothetical protein